MHHSKDRSLLQFRSLAEGLPGGTWARVFQHGWPGWRSWYVARGGRNGPSLRESRRALGRFMPEMVKLWDQLVATVEADEDVARFLTFWCPPRYLVNCSQAVLVDVDGPLLVRNYDLDPPLNEATLLDSAWRRRRVIGMVEGMSGLADGMNDAGLAVSLTFGGRVTTGRGFGIPWIVRYVLEVCNDVPSAIEALRAVPCHMSYNVTALDRDGDWASVMLSPDRPPMVSRAPSITNHQLGIEWPRHGRLSNTLARAAFLETLLERPQLGGAGLIDAFLQPPLFETGYARGFGTVYTAAYRPALGEVTLLWPHSPAQTWRIGNADARTFQVRYSAEGSSIVDTEVPEPLSNQRLGAIALRHGSQSSEDWYNLNWSDPSAVDQGEA
jgi:predicted choloylglycine hydrolase